MLIVNWCGARPGAHSGAVPSGPGAASVRVWAIMSRAGGQGHGGRRRRVPSLGYRPKADVCLTRIEATLYLHCVSAAAGLKLVS
jgi:hypothetical protein